MSETAIRRLAHEVLADAAALRGPLVDDAWDALPLALFIVGIPRWCRAMGRLESAKLALREKRQRLRAMTAALRGEASPNPAEPSRSTSRTE
jgi:hypothetical protein